MVEHIRAALESHLAGMTPELDTAWENVSYTPTDGVPYQRVALLLADAENPTLGQERVIDRGIFQVSLVYPQGTGPAAAQARVTALRERFPAGLVLTSGGYSIRIERTPSGVPALQDEGRYTLPVSIRFICIH